VFWGFGVRRPAAVDDDREQGGEPFAEPRLRERPFAIARIGHHLLDWLAFVFPEGYDFTILCHALSSHPFPGSQRRRFGLS
jgi:hypothetical protein